MSAPAKVLWISDSFLQAAEDPFQGWNSKLLEKVFSNVPDQDRDALIQENKWVMLGRRVATTLSSLPPFSDQVGRSSDYFGNFVDFVAHVLTASLLKHQNSEEAQGYIKRVDQILKPVLLMCGHNADVLKEMDFSQILNHVDVPNNERGIGITLDIEKHKEAFGKLFAKSFQPGITSEANLKEKSLSAVVSEDAQKTIAAKVKEMVNESKLITDSENLLEKGFSSLNILGSNEIHAHIEKQVNLLSVADRFDLHTINAEDAREKSRQSWIKRTHDAMQNFVNENSTLTFSPKEMTVCFVPGANSIVFEVKVALEDEAISKVRRGICHGIVPKVNQIAVLFVEIQPMEVLEIMPETLFDVIELVYKQLEDKSLGFVLDILKMDRAKNKVAEDIKSFLKEA